MGVVLKRCLFTIGLNIDEVSGVSLCPLAQTSRQMLSDLQESDYVHLKKKKKTNTVSQRLCEILMH